MNIYIYIFLNIFLNSGSNLTFLILKEQNFQLISNFKDKNAIYLSCKNSSILFLSLLVVESNC